jgi:sterol desaturase/sphingolipid hydroxylase (fatty acid hydroxylase superfamily)
VSGALVLIAFAALVVSACCRRDGWTAIRARTPGDWLLDGSGLLMQGLVVPLAQTAAVPAALRWAAPEIESCLAAPAAVAFLCHFVGVDYAYYWNHRGLHRPSVWRWHAVHHTAPRMDVLVTSRNTLWTHFLIVYVWLNALGLFLLRDPSPFVLSIAVTAALDLWRHSESGPAPGSRAGRLVAWVLITPHAHAWHHSAERTGVNFGANLACWDRLHGSYLSPAERPAGLGVTLDAGTWARLARPAAAAP